jgi:NADPH:quinone reductase-like Zn-dependent oxidoreductase
VSRVIVARERGAPEVLVVEERAVPDARPGQCKVRVATAGVAFGDVMRRRGLLTGPGPLTPGYDIVGEVLEGDLPAGTRVAALMPNVGHGGYAEEVLLPTEHLVAVPDAVSDVTAVALGLNYISAWQLLSRLSNPEPDDVVLVHGASGGVGTALLDLCALRGVRAYGTASAARHDLVRSRGAEPIDYRSEDFVEVLAQREPRGVHVVYDGMGGPHLLRSAAVLRRSGRLVSYGATGHSDRGWMGLIRGQLPYLQLKLDPGGPSVRMYAITVTRGCGWRACREDWGALLALAEAGQLSPHVGAVVPLEEAARAHTMLEARTIAGKVVLRV